MIEFLAILILTLWTPGTATTAKGFSTCVWPNRCKAESTVAQFKPCVWPNRCGGSSQRLG